MVDDGGTGFAQRYDLGMRGGIRIRDITIPSTPHDPPVTYNDGTHRHLSFFQRPLGAAQSLFHPQFVRMNCRSIAVVLKT
jgi:hypothetical protein